MEQRFLEQARHYLFQYRDRISACAERLTGEQLWWRPNAHSNSIANLVLHVCGNLSQWLLQGLGGRDYQRRRAYEFAARERRPRDELLAGLEEVVTACADLLSRLSAEDLRTRRMVQGYDTDGLGIVLHAVEHASYHTGQIVLLAKQLLPEGEAPEFYPQHREE